MKKRNFLLAFLLILTICVFGQKNVKKYYYYINKAELAYCKENYNSSSDYFEKAFREMTPYTKDIYCYFKLYNTHHVGDKKTIIEQAHILAQRDLLYYDKFEENAELYNILKCIKDTTKITIIKPLIDSLQTILDLDQSLRLNKLSFTDEELREIAFIDSINIGRILSLYKDYGTINENNAGLFYRLISLVLFHNSKTSLIELPFEFLKNEVRKGNLDAREFMSMYDECNANREAFYGPQYKPMIQYGTDMKHHIIIGKTLFIYSPKNFKQINKNRKAIGIYESWDDFKVKLIYTFQADDYKFVNIQEEIWGSDEETQKVEMETRKEIDDKKYEGEYHNK